MKIDTNGNLIPDKVEGITWDDLMNLKQQIHESGSTLVDATWIMSPKNRDLLNKSLFKTSRTMGTTPRELQDYTINEIYGIPIVESRFVSDKKVWLVADDGIRTLNR